MTRASNELSRPVGGAIEPGPATPVTVARAHVTDVAAGASGSVVPNRAFQTRAGNRSHRLSDHPALGRVVQGPVASGEGQQRGVRAGLPDLTRSIPVA